jgi:hypothetical protein
MQLSSMHVHAGRPCCISNGPCRLSMQHVHASYLCCML